MGKKKSANNIKEAKARKRAANKKKYAKQHKEKLSMKKNKRMEFISKLQDEYLKRMVEQFEKETG